MTIFWTVVITLLCVAWGGGMVKAARLTRGMPLRQRWWVVLLWPLMYLVRVQ